MTDQPSDDQPQAKALDLGIYNRRMSSSGLSAAETIALVLTVLWLAGVTVFFFVIGRGGSGDGIDPLRIVMLLFAVFMPVALFWVAAIAMNSARVMREEAVRLQTAIDAMRQTYVAQSQSAHMRPSASVERKLDQIMAAQSRQGAESAFATFASIREERARAAPPPPPAREEQPSFALVDAPEPSAEVTIEDFIVALNFPETAEDREGFRALRRAMQDRRAAELITASQDILTLLSQEGIYMDDLTPDRARPEIWRRFAEGSRGKPVATLGGIRDRSCLALTAARMRNDPVFRDAAHHFLRKFDKVFGEFEKHATDAEIAALSETRTARAFMLLGRVTGIFT
jgi:Zn-dependent protease with chaperone function